MSPAVSKVATGGRCQQVAEWVLPGLRRQVEEVGPQGRPGGFSGEPRDVPVGLVELCDGLGSEELFGCDLKAVGVALHRLEKPGRWVVELAQQGGGGDRRFIAGKNLLQRLGRGAGCDSCRSNDAVRVAVADIRRKPGSAQYSGEGNRPGQLRRRTGRGHGGTAARRGRDRRCPSAWRECTSRCHRGCSTAAVCGLCCFRSGPSAQPQCR